MTDEKGERRREKGVFLFSLLPSLFSSLIVASAHAQSPPPIADNSFLIEEAYNQEPGVVQHINTFTRPNGGSSWGYSFTQEWPFLSQRYQLSYTVPVLHDETTGTGIGDVGLNFRYQLLGGAEAAVHLAPRLTVLVPTGSEERGRGAGGAGLQVNIPLSWVPRPKLAIHWNAGLTLSPGSRPTPTLGASAVWLVRPEFNLLVETLWLGGDEKSLLLNPGIRWAFNFQSGLQIVPAVAYTIGLDSNSGDGLFLYLSFEHAFRRRR